MAHFDDLYDAIRYKKVNDIDLKHAEITVYNMFVECMVNTAFNVDYVETINIEEINEKIKLKMLGEKQYIAKLVFSNNQCLYVKVKILLGIEYFKNMIDNYDFVGGGELVVEFIMCKEMDNCNFVSEIVTYVDTGKYENGCMTFREFYDGVVMLDYMGPIYYNFVTMMRKITQNNIYDYEDNTLNNFNHVYKLLEQNGIININQNLVELWKNIIDIENNIDVVLEMPIFKNYVMLSSHGKHFILKHKIIKFYTFIINDISSVTIMDSLLDMNSVEAWKILVEIRNMELLASNKKTDQGIYYVNKHLENNIDKITDIFFSVDISVFSETLQKKLKEKYGK